MRREFLSPLGELDGRHRRFDVSRSLAEHFLHPHCISGNSAMPKCVSTSFPALCSPLAPFLGRYGCCIPCWFLANGHPPVSSPALTGCATQVVASIFPFDLWLFSPIRFVRASLVLDWFECRFGTPRFLRIAQGENRSHPGAFVLHPLFSPLCESGSPVMANTASVPFYRHYPDLPS